MDYSKFKFMCNFTFGISGIVDSLPSSASLAFMPINRLWSIRKMYLAQTLTIKSTDKDHLRQDWFSPNKYSDILVLDMFLKDVHNL